MDTDHRKTALYRPRSHTPVQRPTRKHFDSVHAALAADGLAIRRDPSTGRLRSRDGRKPDPNLPVAQILSEDYGRNEGFCQRMRQIASSKQAMGFADPENTGLTGNALKERIRLMSGIGLITRYTPARSGYYVQLNPKAVSFLTKEFAQIYICDYIRRRFRPDEIYFDVSICGERTGSELFALDVVCRQGSSFMAVVTALNTNLLNAPNQLDRLTRVMERLHIPLKIVVSPAVDTKALSEQLRRRLGRPVSAGIVPYTWLDLLSS